MSIDKQKLKALAEAVADLEDIPEREDEHAEAVDALWLNVHCHTILALLAEIERLEEEFDKAWRHGLNDKNNAQTLAAEITRLQTENDALRTGQAIKRLSGDEVREAFNGAYYQPRDIGSDGEQCRAGVLAVIEAAMVKEANQ